MPSQMRRPNGSTPSIPVRLFLSIEEQEKIQRIADAEERSFANVCTMLVRRALSAHAWPTKKIK
jgi:hypothetical protein